MTLDAAISSDAAIRTLADALREAGLNVTSSEDVLRFSRGVCAPPSVSRFIVSGTAWMDVAPKRLCFEMSCSWYAVSTAVLLGAMGAVAWDTKVAPLLFGLGYPLVVALNWMLARDAVVSAVALAANVAVESVCVD